MGILRLTKGAHAVYGGQAVVVANRPSPLQVQIRFEDGRVEQIDPQQLLAPEGPVPVRGTDTHGASERQMKEACRRHAIIKPLLQLGPGERTRAMVQSRAEASRDPDNPKDRLCAETLYDWMRAYEASGELLSTLRGARADRGKHHLPEAVVVILHEQLERAAPSLGRAANRTAHRLLFKELMTDVKVACKAKDVQAPHPNTVRKALNRLHPLRRARATGSRKEQARHEPLTGVYEGASSHASVVQIDHTMLDIIVVDDDGEPIARPWLTLAIHLKSRMVVGLELSLYPPGTHTTLSCLAQAILPKTPWLERHGLDPATHPWPCFGKMHKVHSDNGKDFWAESVRRALIQHGIDHHFRMVGKAHWGSHIESLMGTVSGELQTLRGYTGPNTVTRADLALHAQRDAVMTMKRLREWLMNWVLNIYHQRWHEGLKGFPQDAYLRDQLEMGGLPELITGEQAEKLRIDFLPSFTAAVTSRGVIHDRIRYYDPVLDHLVGVREHARSKLSKTHRFHYSPHDVSVLHLYDEALGGYQRVRFADVRRPAVTSWEVRAGLKRLNALRLGKVNEERLFQAILEGRRILELARTETRGAKAARRTLAKQQESADRAGTVRPAPGAELPQVPALQTPSPQTPPTPAPLPEAIPDFPVSVRGVRA